MPEPAGVAPSILAADFARLGAQVAEVMAAGARTIHVDVMDGHFVPPLSMGADGVTLHVEATPHVNYALAAVRDAGCRAGLALCPSTPVEAVAEVVDDLDLVLCMTVNPGWGGQAFLPGSVAKVERLRALVGERPALEVDGGIDGRTAGACARAGATVFVAGSAVFGADDPAAAFRAIAEEARS